MQEVTEFQVLQLKSQLENSLETNGSSHKESLKLLLQYSKMLGQYAEQQEYTKSVQLYTQAYQLLLPSDPPKLLTIQSQYWRLLIMISIKLSQNLAKNQQPQQALNVLIQVEALIKKQKKQTAEWAYLIQLECLYFHLSLAWNKINNKERCQAMANECLLLIKQDIKLQFKEKYIYMLVEMFQLLAQFKKNDLHSQLDYFNQIYTYCAQYIGKNHHQTQKALMKVNQLKAQITFEKEIDNLDFRHPPNRHVAAQTQLGFYEDDSQIQELLTAKKSSRRQLTATEFQLNSIKQSIISPHSQPKQQSTQFKTKKLSNLRKSAEDLKKFTDIMISPSTAKSRQESNKLFYWINYKNSNPRIKTETTQWRTSNSKDQDVLHLTPNMLTSPNILTSPKTEKSLNHSLFQDNKRQSPQNKISLLLQRPKSSACFQRIQKQLVIQTDNHNNQNNQYQQNLHLQKEYNLKRQCYIKEKAFKFNNNKKSSSAKKTLSTFNILPPELSNQSDQKYQQQDSLVQGMTILYLVSMPQASDLIKYEKETQAALTIQKYYKEYVQLRKLVRGNKKKLTTITINKPPNSESNNDDQESVETFNSMVMSLRVTKQSAGYKRSNTASIDQQLIRHAKQKSGSSSQILLPQMIKQIRQAELQKTPEENTQINEEDQLSDFSVDFRNKSFLSIFGYKFNEEIQLFSFNFADQAIKIREMNLLIYLRQIDEEKQEVLRLIFFVEINSKISELKLEVLYTKFQNKIRKTKNDTLELANEIILEYMDNHQIEPKKMINTIMFISTKLDQNQFEVQEIGKLESLVMNLFQILNYSEIQKKENGREIRYSKEQITHKLLTHYKQQQKKLKKYILQIPPVLFPNSEIFIQDEVQLEEEGRGKKDKFKKAKNAILFAVRAQKRKSTEKPPQPPRIPLILLEDQDETPISLEMSCYQDTDYNRMQLKNIINPHKKRRSHLESSFNQLIKSSHHSHKQSQSPLNQSSLFKKTQTIEQVNQLFTFGENKQEHKLLRQDMQYIRGFQQEEESEEDTSRNKQFLMKSEIVSPKPELEIKGLHQFNKEQDGDDKYQFQTIYKKDEHFTVSPYWKKQKASAKVRKNMNTFDSLKNPFHMPQKFEVQNLYLNPFPQEYIIYCGTAKVEETFFLVKITQISNEHSDLFNTTFINKKNLITIRVTYQVLKPLAEGWNYQIEFKFKEFMRWFIPDFNLTNYVRNIGLSKQQKSFISDHLKSYISIQDSKLRVNYAAFSNVRKDKKRKPQSKQNLYYEQIERIILLCQRDKLNLQEELLYYGLEQYYEKYINLKEQIQSKLQKNQLFKQVLRQPTFEEIDEYGDVVQNTIVLPQNLQNQLLKQYNSIQYKRGEKIILKIQDWYIIWQNDLIKIWNPFMRITWNKVYLQSAIEKFINIYQSHMNKRLISKNIISKYTLIGRKFYIYRQNYSHQEIDPQTQFLIDTYNSECISLNTQYKYLEEIKYSLLTKPNSEFWKRYFQSYNYQTHAKVRGIGDCLAQMTLFWNPKQYFVLVKLYQFQNMRTNEFKITFTDHDLSLITNNHYSQYDKEIFNDLHRILNKYLSFKKSGINKIVQLHFQNMRTNTNFNLTDKFPWVKKFNYSQSTSIPYSTEPFFFHKQKSELITICHCTRLINIPHQTFNLSKAKYIDYATRYDQEKKLFEIRTPCVFTILKSIELQIFFIQFYFPHNQRKLFAQINFSDIMFKQQKLSFQFKEQLKSKKSEKLWLQMIENFKLQFTQQNKILLSIEKLQITCILQEILHYDIKHTLHDQTSILFITYIENKSQQDPDVINISTKFPKLKISDSHSYNLYLKLLWIQQPVKMQSYRLPLQELLLGYIRSQNLTTATFDFLFKQSDLIHLCKSCIENVIINFATKTFDASLEYIIPKEIIVSNQKQMKLNLSQPGIRLNKTLLQLIFRGVLMKQLQVIIGIYNDERKQQILFYVQNLKNCLNFKFKCSYGEIENLIPCLSSNLKFNPHQVGLQIFQAYKNQMILKCFYNFQT